VSQIARLWVLATLKTRWTTRIIVLPGAPSPLRVRLAAEGLWLQLQPSVRLAVDEGGGFLSDDHAGRHSIAGRYARQDRAVDTVDLEPTPKTACRSASGRPRSIRRKVTTSACLAENLE
jgi:hypothetical protein